MHPLEVYIYKIDNKKLANSKAITKTQNDSDWEEIETSKIIFNEIKKVFNIFFLS